MLELGIYQVEILCPVNETATEESNPGFHQPFDRGSVCSGRITWKTHNVKQRGHLEVFYLANQLRQEQELVMGQCLVETVCHLVDSSAGDRISEIRSLSSSLDSKSWEV